MRALVADGTGGAVIREVAEPSPAPGDVVVEVYATSLNRGEMTRLRNASDGWRPGWDVAGTVVGSGDAGPPVGARVVGWVGGEAWAERVAVPAGCLAELGDVDFVAAAAMPTAGLAALRMLRLGPGALGRRLVVTGAAGGVGRIAVQLAHLGGAHVTAVVRGPERAQGLRELGADEVVTDLAELRGPFDLVLESVGGESLARLATLLDPRGTLVVFGNSSNQPTVFRDIRDFYLGGERCLQAFTLFHGFPADPPGRDLGYLVDLVRRGVLDPHIDSVLSWTDLGAALERLSDRSVLGKLVLKVR